MRKLPSRPRLASHFQSVLVVGDTRSDVNRIVATLRGVLGYTFPIRTASTANAALEEVFREAPYLMIMDDVLAPNDTALSVMPLFRRASYAGPIVIASRVTSEARTRKLLDAGAAFVVNKDHLDAGSLSNILGGLGLMEEVDRGIFD